MLFNLLGIVLGITLGSWTAGAAPYGDLSVTEKAAFWQERQQAYQWSRELAQPLGQLAPQRRFQLLETLIPSAQDSGHPLKQLAATLILFYDFRAPLREEGSTLRNLITSAETPLYTRWIATLIWLSHGGPSLSPSETRDALATVRQGVRSLSEELAHVPQEDLFELESETYHLPLSQEALWILDDPWLKYVPLSAIPHLSWSDRQKFHQIQRFSVRLEKHRRWKAQLQKELTPAAKLCSRALLTDIQSADAEEILRNPLTRR